MLKTLTFLLTSLLALGLNAQVLGVGGPNIHLKVDLAMPDYYTGIPIPGSLKPGWIPFAASGWEDMYGHDVRYLYDIDGTGINAGISTAREGNGGLKCYNMCMYSKVGAGPPQGQPVGDPIANTWFYNVDWGGNPRGNVILSLFCLPPGKYVLKSYHNFWIFCSGAARTCTTCRPSMPPMPRVWAIGLIDADPGALGLYGYSKLVNAAENAGCLGNHGGVELLADATNVEYTSTLVDENVATSLIRFHTDGSAVLVIYEAPEDWMDPRGRDGGRGVLNAFELKVVPPADINIDGVVNFYDFAVLAQHRMSQSCGFPDWCEGADLNKDGNVDIADLRIFVESWLEDPL